MTGRPHRTILLAVLAFVLTTLCLAVTSQPAAAAGDLIEVDPDSVVVEAPAPGRSVEWTMTARNVTDRAVPLTLTAAGLGGALFEGEHPLDVLVVGPEGDVLLEGGDVVGQGDLTVDLPELPAGGEYVVHGRAAMPAEAGDEYRGAEGSVTLRFVATAQSEGEPGAPGIPGGGLASTGAGVMLLATLAVVLIGAGTTAYVSTRKRRTP
ncbi:hypothetical protein ASE27_17925 [Oerskovia sp. Root918]|uniref:hypothetical protein n=1 Tax=Oerskovia sp. Root918 TaxID=1736607 RepID=UPI0006F28D8C|nr:hypothetical protein [Oerskovia sp. Root918]KRD42711.1 hypothetical protein ASE27_17925 [Oerskovia sp. Root918]